MYLNSMASKITDTSADLLGFHKDACHYLMHAKSNPKLELITLKVQTIASDLNLLAMEAKQLVLEKPECECNPCRQLNILKKVRIFFTVF
jgi:hypothetical protein